MKYCRSSATCAVLLAWFAATGFALAGEPVVNTESTSTSSSTADTASTFSVSGEYLLEGTYVGDGEMTRGKGRDVHDFNETDFIARFVFTPDVKIGVLRLGFEWECYDFDFSRRPLLPDTLHALSAVVGLDTQFSDSILMRIEAQPGVYSDDLDEAEDAFNVPFVIGGTYIYSTSLQFVFGVGVDFERSFPVLPGGGVRWKIAPEWVLNAVLPTPRLEFTPAKSVTLYVGANVKETSYRLDEDFFLNNGRRASWSDAVVTYTEVRTGGGVDWEILPALTVSAEAGYVPYRTFDFHRVGLRFKEEEGAPYGMLSLHGSF